MELPGVSVSEATNAHLSAHLRGCLCCIRRDTVQIEGARFIAGGKHGRDDQRKLRGPLKLATRAKRTQTEHRAPAPHRCAATFVPVNRKHRQSPALRLERAATHNKNVFCRRLVATRSIPSPRARHVVVCRGHAPRLAVYPNRRGFFSPLRLPEANREQRRTRPRYHGYSHSRHFHTTQAPPSLVRVFGDRPSPDKNGQFNDNQTPVPARHIIYPTHHQAIARALPASTPAAPHPHYRHWQRRRPAPATHHTSTLGHTAHYALLTGSL